MDIIQIDPMVDNCWSDCLCSIHWIHLPICHIYRPQPKDPAFGSQMAQMHLCTWQAAGSKGRDPRACAKTHKGALPGSDQTPGTQVALFEPELLAWARLSCFMSWDHP